ncbi:family 20 glycosylhydrolase [Parashewanella tropica]|uniref:family 20 glycosylhydrolase n=1 Tax=Parashewanella tropica TaxID=2547970 RepID=UPI001059F52C|nr:family 20 glycosylhydrolase [Parashewanella tropica]
MINKKAKLTTLFCATLLGHSAFASNAVIETVPSIKSWSGGAGQFSALNNANVIINSNSSRTESTLSGITTTVTETANHFILDLKATTGLNYQATTNNTANSGDVLLTLLNTYDSSIGDEGYKLDIGDYVEVKANTVTGLYYGTQSLLQALKSDDDNKDIAKGTVSDFPTLPERGIMIDAGRKYWQLSYLKDLIRVLGWQKMNRLHLHLTEWNAFRLSSNNPALNGLAALGSYTESEINELEALAKKHHVIIVPEIDIPGHAKLLGDFSKSDAFSCNSMSRPGYSWEGASGPRWTIDYTGISTNSPNTGRDFLYSIVDEFLPWFDGPYFHIGTDEVPESWRLSNCSELTNYVEDTPSLSTPGDVLVEFIDEMNQRIKSHGKKTQMWNWYERQNTSIEPANDILVDVWAGNAESAYINLGFDVIKTGAGGFYLTPGFENTFPSNSTIYTWNSNASSKVKGVKVSVWTDTAYTWPDQQFESLMFDSRAVSAERNWSGAQSSSTLNNFLAKARKLGRPDTTEGEQHTISKKNWTVHSAGSQETSSEDGKASNIFDGLGTTIWHSNYSNGSNDNFPYNVDIDLGANYDLYGARFQARRNQGRDLNGLVNTYDFAVSSDGVNWTIIIENGEFYDLVNERKARRVDFQKQTARYVRFTAKSATNGKKFAALAELDLFGTTVGGNAIVHDRPNIQIRPKTDMSFCLGIDRENGSVANGDTAEMRVCNKTDEYQKWERHDEGNGFYSIRLANNTNICLDVNRGSDQKINAGDEILVWNCHLGDNQLWKIGRETYGFFSLKPKGDTEACIDITASSSSIVSANDDINLQNCDANDEQQWVLIE